MNAVLIIAAQLSAARREKLYDENGDLKPGKGAAADSVPKNGSTFTVNDGEELYVGFPIADQEGRYKSSGAAQFSNKAIPVGSMGGLEKLFKAEIKAAQKQWNLFSIWAEKVHKVKLGTGKLLLILEE